MCSVQTVDKASQSFSPAGEKAFQSVFSGGVYVAENTSHGMSVDLCVNGAQVGANGVQTSSLIKSKGLCQRLEDGARAPSSFAFYTDYTERVFGCLREITALFYRAF